MAAEYFSIETDLSEFRGNKFGVPLQQPCVLENIFLQKRNFIDVGVVFMLTGYIPKGHS